MKKIESYSSVLAVENLERSLKFYTEGLGFALESSHGEPMYFASIRRDDAQSISLLCMKNAIVCNNTIATLAFRCQGIDELYEEFKSNGVAIDEEIGNQEYAMREFRIKDPDGYLLYFQEPLGSND